MKKNLVLVGLMGSGKTTLGKLLAKSTLMPLIDTDTEIEKESGKTISKIFELYGEALFRKLESKVIKDISKKSDQIISTGGGALQDNSNIENLKENGVLFYLKARPEELFNRIKHDKTRPLLQNKHPLETLKKQLKQRETNYIKAQFTIETQDKTANETVKEILENYKNYEKQYC